MRSKAVKVIKRSKNNPAFQEASRIFFIVVGALLVAFGLEGFLIPNGFLDGGVTGISIILATFIPIPMGIFLAILNIPFILLTWLKVGHASAIRTAIGVAVLAVSTVILHHMEPVTDEFLLALAYGGGLLGLGIGLALRQGGALDGTEALAAILADRTRWSVNQLILGVNIVIFISASFVLDQKYALASAALFFLVVAPVIKRVVDGDSGAKRARVVTAYPDEVAEALSPVVHRRILQESARVYRDGAFKEQIRDLTFTLPRLQEAEVTQVILDVDPDAVVSFTDIASLRGGIYEKTHGH
jgi:uncharacterized membrane-anchored protein YitT (DUF2179 family)